MNFFFKIQDIPLYVIIIAAIAYPIITRQEKTNTPGGIELILNRKVIAIYNRYADSTYTFQDFSIEVKNGQARIIKSCCKDHLCEKYGWLDSLSHNRVICLPNKLILKNQILQENTFDDITE